jgi:hypothetical protein
VALVTVLVSVVSLFGAYTALVQSYDSLRSDLARSDERRADLVVTKQEVANLSGQVLILRENKK